MECILFYLFMIYWSHGQRLKYNDTNTFLCAGFVFNVRLNAFSSGVLMIKNLLLNSLITLSHLFCFQQCN